MIIQPPITPTPRPTPVAGLTGDTEVLNILLIVADDLGIEQLRVFGKDPSNTYAPTPNIDRMAQQGVRFQRAYSMPVCSPTRACLLTGRYPFRTGIGNQAINSQQPLLVNETCLPKALRQGTGNEYRSACFGKWHLSTFLNGDANHPNDVGFERYRGALTNFERGEENFFAWKLIDDGVVKSCTRYSPTQNVDDALAWIRTAREPWFCYLPFNTIHEPFHRPPADLYDTSLYVLPNSEPIGAESVVPYHKAMIQAMDTEIGRLLANIPQSTMANTVVMFYSDNGTTGPAVVPGYGFAGGHNKGSVYEDGCNVPLIVMGPRVDTPGRISTHFVNAVDLFATVLDIAGADMTQVTSAGTVDSVSFWPHLKDKDALTLRSVGQSKGYIFVEQWTPNGPNQNATTSQGSRALRMDRFKLVTRAPGPVNAAINEHTFVSYAADKRDQLFDITGGLLSGVYSPGDRHEAADLLGGIGDPTGIHPEAATGYNACVSVFNPLIASP